MKKSTAYFAVAIMATFASGLSSCSIFKGADKSGGKATASAEASSAKQMSASETAMSDALTGDWTIIDINGTRVQAPEDDCPYIGFQPSASVPGKLDFYAYNGCNFINGKVSVRNGIISHSGDFISTMKMCPDAKYESAISNVLGIMKSLKIQRISNESFLYINDASGNTVMTLRRHNLNFLEGAWKVTKLGDNKVPSKVGMQIVIDMATRTIHGNAGCNILNGTLSIDMERENGIKFSKLATTRMTCPDIALEQEFLKALGEVHSAVQVGGNNAHLRDLSGNTIIVLRRMSKDELRSE